MLVSNLLEILKVLKDRDISKKEGVTFIKEIDSLFGDLLFFINILINILYGLNCFGLLDRRIVIFILLRVALMAITRLRMVDIQLKEGCGDETPIDVKSADCNFTATS